MRKKTFLLAAVNAKYIHSNPAVLSLKAYAEMRRAEGRAPSGCFSVETAEYTINHEPDRILQDLYRRKPAVIGFSCYLWNIGTVLSLVRDLAVLLPGLPVWLGGPEVSYDAGELLAAEPAITGIMTGEGEETFSELLSYYESGESLPLQQIPGLTYREKTGEGDRIRVTAPRQPLSMDELPFLYQDLTPFANRILYYESSRGCPYSCSYCLSSVEKQVRFRSLSLVLPELQHFLDKRVPQVKFVDRTFNCSRKHALAIWQYLLEHDNGITNFHFEITGDLLCEEDFAVLSRMRPGLIQLEIGVQTANPQTTAEIRRDVDLKKLSDTVARIRSFRNIHQHLDLIAGLPCEDYDSFLHSYDVVYRMRPDQLQLGFLKVLKGSRMAEMAAAYQLRYHRSAPYEVLSTAWLSYDEVLQLKLLEEMNEVYYNSGQFTETLSGMEAFWTSPCAMFLELGSYYVRHQLTGLSHSRLARYEILHAHLTEHFGGRCPETLTDCLMTDLCLREPVKSRPSFAPDPSSWKEAVKAYHIEEKAHPQDLYGYEAYDSRQTANMTHIERLSDGRFLLFDYLRRDPFHHNARKLDITGRIRALLPDLP